MSEPPSDFGYEIYGPDEPMLVCCVCGGEFIEFHLSEDTCDACMVRIAQAIQDIE